MTKIAKRRIADLAVTASAMTPVLMSAAPWAVIFMLIYGMWNYYVGHEQALSFAREMFGAFESIAPSLADGTSVQ